MTQSIAEQESSILNDSLKRTKSPVSELAEKHATGPARLKCSRFFLPETHSQKYNKFAGSRVPQIESNYLFNPFPISKPRKPSRTSRG
jgi:hypothetical protein